MLPKIKDLCVYRIEKAKNDLNASQMLFGKKFFAQSMNRSYYAIFHMARALLALDEFESRKHTGIIAYFNKNYIATGIFEKIYSKIIKGAERKRTKSDYDDFYIVSRDEAEEQVKNAKQFIEEIERFIKKKLKE